MDANARPIEIPSSAVSPEALSGIIDNFILREGTDYGVQEITLDKKREQIQRQLNQGKIVIVFDPATESVTLLNLADWVKWKTQFETSDD